ncbi:hypothetical protein ACFX2I_008532 [Malus domestica]
MDQQNSTTTPTPSTSQPPTESPPTAQSQPPPQPQPPPPSSLPTTPTSTPTPPPPNPNPNPKASTPLPQQPPPQSLPPPSQPRTPSTLARPPPWQQSHFHHFPSPSSSASSGPPPPPPPSASQPPPPRGGIAIGVPAHHTGPSPPQPTPYSSSYGHHFGGMGRGGVSVPESVSNSSPSQVRPSMQGMGMMGSLGSSSQMRPTGIPAHHPQRPVQSSVRPPSTASNQSPSSQNFQGHSLLRVSSVGSGSLPNTSPGLQPHTQPWLSSGSQGKPPMPSPSYRQQMNSPSMQQRSHLPQQQPHPTAPQQQHHSMPSASQQQHHPLPSASPQQHHPMPSASQQQHTSSAQHQQPSSSHQGPEHFGQQVQPSRVPQTMPRQQQITRVQGPVNPKSSTLVAAQPNTVQSGAQNKTPSPETDESCNRILGKRSIRELVNQIDPSEKLDPEVEEILMDIADEFVDSVSN